MIDVMIYVYVVICVLYLTSNEKVHTH